MPTRRIKGYSPFDFTSSILRVKRAVFDDKSSFLLSKRFGFEIGKRNASNLGKTVRALFLEGLSLCIALSVESRFGGLDSCKSLYEVIIKEDFSRASGLLLSSTIAASRIDCSNSGINENFIPNTCRGGSQFSVNRQKIARPEIFRRMASPPKSNRMLSVVPGLNTVSVKTRRPSRLILQVYPDGAPRWGIRWIGILITSLRWRRNWLARRLFSAETGSAWFRRRLSRRSSKSTTSFLFLRSKNLTEIKVDCSFLEYYE